MAIFLVLLLLIHLFSNLKLSLNGGLEVYDYGIYQQGVFNLASGEGLNPFLTVRNIHLFNDHFAPIIFLAVPFVWLTNYHVSSMIIFEWLTFVLFIFMAFRLARPKGWLEYLAIAFLIIFSKGLLHGLIWPIHPGVWSTSAWLVLVYFLYKGKGRGSFWGIILASLFLCLFRYSYPFCILTLAVYFGMLREWKKAGALFLISSLFLGFIFVGRGMLWGETHDYGSKILEPLLAHPFGEIFRAGKNFDWGFAFKILFPFLIPLYFVFKAWKEERFSLRNPFLGVLFLMAPYLFLHFLYNKFNFHYGIGIISPLIGVVLFSGALKKVLEKRALVVCFFLAFFFSGNSTHRRVIKKLMARNVDGSLFIGEKRRLTNELQEQLRKIPLGKTIISESKLATTVLFPGLKIFIPSVDMVHLSGYDYVLVENAKARVKAGCLNEGNRILVENRFYLLIQGKIGSGCYKHVRQI